MAENIEQTDKTVVVSELSDTDVVIKYCLENKISKDAIDELLKRGYTSLEALQLVEMGDLVGPKSPRASAALESELSEEYNFYGDLAASYRDSLSCIPTQQSLDALMHFLYEDSKYSETVRSALDQIQERRQQMSETTSQKSSINGSVAPSKISKSSSLFVYIVVPLAAAGCISRGCACLGFVCLG